MFPDPTRCRVGDHDNAERRDLLDHDVVCWHVVLLSDMAEPCLDPEQMVPLPLEIAFHLRLTQQQHPAQLIHGDAVEEPPDLPEGQAQVLERDDTVELAQLLRRVGAVAGDRINLGRRQQADLVVVPQGADGHRAEPGELPDAEHDTSMPPSRNVRVNHGRRP